MDELDQIPSLTKSRPTLPTLFTGAESHKWTAPKRTMVRRASLPSAS